MQLQSYSQGQWIGKNGGLPLYHAINGSKVAEISSDGVDFAGMLDYGRSIGGVGLRALTFHQRALCLKAVAQYLMERKEEFYQLSAATGATRTDSWIDIEGGLGTFFTYSGKGRRELPNDFHFVEGAIEPLSRHGSFIGQHICAPLHGVAVHINAYNFPCWGMLEKLAPTLLAGMPAVVKPASQTAYLTELMVRRIIESGILPEGSLQLICGSVGNLLDHVNCQDVVTFTGSASTGLKLRQHPAIVNNSVRFNMEADSLNCSILGPDVQPDMPEFDLFVQEVVREMTVKAGQKCTAIRRAIVPAERIDALTEALRIALAKVRVGDPALEGVRMGALASRGQCDEVNERVAQLASVSEQVFGNLEAADFLGADEQSACMTPQLMLCNEPLTSHLVHDVEAFGPVSTILPYHSLDEAVDLAKRGQGSLVGSVITHSPEVAKEVVQGISVWHGRVLVLDRSCAKESTGHGSPLPGLVHGGPGRAGGGEEMGGIRGVMHYMQRTALQGSPNMLTAVTNQWLTGSDRIEDDVHPFRKHFEELAIGDSIVTEFRQVSLADIEHFAEFSGDKFYAHMDEQAAAANPFFDGRVAHGYFIVSAAAGLFVHPDPGPVLANYGLENLRFMKPFYPGDAMQVSLTCKQKVNRETEDYGEVRWDTTVVNQDGDVVAQYDVLTLVANLSS
ncbi:MAG: oxepin-CoA hydrolase/3-oxo-5,6-dehydrosuberyl-CoA semialdehyde dehydrogenase [Parasphingorhabdus sp.]|jgi:oxepin-CoA hydrolase/3-oxo-5,6-dehydrosuberyl-CoA semialdehyde dehydrogenase